jgi:hypothetical protein
MIFLNNIEGGIETSLKRIKTCRLVVPVTAFLAPRNPETSTKAKNRLCEVAHFEIKQVETRQTCGSHVDSATELLDPRNVVSEASSKPDIGDVRFLSCRCTYLSRGPPCIEFGMWACLRGI